MTAFRWPVQPGGLAEFEASLPFVLDDFQLHALRCLDAEQSVLVSAPTGSGKTLVAAYAVHRALAARGKAFYTTPLKALSNQKFNELVATYGEEHVGLLTGDSTVRPRAPVVVMTTEVLRNMLLAGSDLLEALHTVVLDEVHFLQDPYRGGVWEEVLVLSPSEIRFVCLSATVHNADELGGWLRSVRGDTAVIVERERPIELRHHFAVHRRENEETQLLPLLHANGKPGGEGQRIDQLVRRALHGRVGQYQSRGRGPRLPVRAPLRTEMIDELDRNDMLPAIVFIFSRAACDDAVRQVLRDGVRLTDAHERKAIREVAERRVESLDDEDLSVLGYDEWLEGLERGVAAHHAGMVPVFRETVEECFAAGLLKVVFATETLSLGINMPARSVVIERFSKYGGAGRATLTSGEYLQLTGRAGRRGLDEEGHAVVSWSNEITFGEMARVAAAPPPDLRSAFRPTYNLAVNLVSRFDRETANEVLHRSFAQWQARKPDLLTRQLGHRLAVLGELGYVDGWSLTPPGGGCLASTTRPISWWPRPWAATSWPGPSPPCWRASSRRSCSNPDGPGDCPDTDMATTVSGGRPEANAGRSCRIASVTSARPSWPSVGEAVAAMAERIRTIEEAHLVPRTRQVAPGLATAVASWVRGASFSTALAVASRDAGDLAPGDFVRTMKSVADLAQQVSHTAEDPEVAASAREAVDQLVRGVVAGGLPSG